MTKDEVIRIRTALKHGSNAPLRIFVDNSFTIVDESNVFQFTKWDDDNETLYSFRLTDPQSSRTPSNIGNSVAVYATPYEFIQAMELVVLPADKLDELFGTLVASGCTMSDDFKNLIKNTYNEILDPRRYEITPTEIQHLLGEEAANSKDDWYNGKYTQSFAETRRYAERNEKVIEAQKKKDEEEGST